MVVRYNDIMLSYVYKRIKKGTYTQLTMELNVSPNNKNNMALNPILGQFSV